MFTSILTEVGKLFDRRLMLNAFFPSLVFWALLIAVGIVGREGNLGQFAAAWDAQSLVLKAVQLSGFAAWIVVFSNLLAGASDGIIRFYEGYWDGPFRLLAPWGSRWHECRLDSLIAQERLDEATLSYPPAASGQVRPTRLGNIMRSAELYPLERYGAKSINLWPRLFGLLPETTVAALVAARSGLEFQLVVSLLGGLFAVIAGIMLVALRADWRLFLVCFWGGMAVAWVSYRGAVGYAQLYAQQIRVTFDLYRHLMLVAMRLRPPRALSGEHRLWHEVDEFLRTGVAPFSDWWFTEPPSGGGKAPG